MKKLLLLAVSLLLCVSVSACSPKETTTSNSETFTGEADGYGGKITAVVTVTDGVITDLELTGDGETEAIGGAALEPLKERILKAGTIDGVDGETGATWTSNGVFAAIRNALGLEEETAGSTTSEVSASGLKQGVGHASTFRLGPGKDDTETPVYSFNEVFAYVITDADGRIVDLEVDILEVITPNHDGAHDNFIAGWPGQTYNYDEDHDGTVDGELTEDEDRWTAGISSFATKRQLGTNYKMNSGTWTEEMDNYEEFFKGMTKEELEETVATLFSDLNGRPLNGKSDKDEDVAKRDGLNDEQLAKLDTLTCATMSVTDAHGDIVKAIVNALDNAEPLLTEENIAKVGMGVDVVYRLGPGKDDQDVPVYSFNIVVAGTAFDANDKIVDTTVDILEIITPNHDGADDNVFIGWPGAEYNSDDDADGTVDRVAVQDEDTFKEAISGYRTKRTLGTAYKMNSGTWTEEMNAYEVFFAGKTTAELKALEGELFSDLNGRPLNGKSDKDADVAKRDALSDDQLAMIDSLSCATMSINDAHGNILAAVVKSFETAKPSVINVK